VVHITGMEKTKNAHKILAAKPDVKKPFWSSRHGWKYIIKKGHNEIGYTHVDWILKWLRISPIIIQKDGSCVKIISPKLHFPYGMRRTERRSMSGLSRLKVIKYIFFKTSSSCVFHRFHYFINPTYKEVWLTPWSIWFS
jgi:hypothetical protein